jgi:hypothetical protein
MASKRHVILASHSFVQRPDTRVFPPIVDAVCKAFQIARAASSVGEDDKRITRSANHAFETRRANINDLSLSQPEPPALVPA